jgi:predicted DNA-binding protein
MNDAKFAIRLPAQRRFQLDALAERTGIPAGSLLRLALVWLLEHHDVLLELGLDRR